MTQAARCVNKLVFIYLAVYIWLVFVALISKRSWLLALSLLPHESTLCSEQNFAVSFFYLSLVQMK